MFFRRLRSSTDTELARIRAFVHDPAAPLLQLIHGTDPSTEGPRGLDKEDVMKAAADTIRLLGNASAQIPKLRRRKILKAVNPDIQDLADCSYILSQATMMHDMTAAAIVILVSCCIAAGHQYPAGSRRQCWRPQHSADPRSPQFPA